MDVFSAYTRCHLVQVHTAHISPSFLALFLPSGRPPAARSLLHAIPVTRVQKSPTAVGRPSTHLPVACSHRYRSAPVRTLSISRSLFLSSSFASPLLRCPFRGGLLLLFVCDVHLSVVSAPSHVVVSVVARSVGFFFWIDIYSLSHRYCHSDSLDLVTHPAVYFLRHTLATPPPP